MASLTTNQAPTYLIGHFIFAYAVLSSRGLKVYHSLDNNASPREDLTRFGDSAVKSGKLTTSQLNTLKRNEAAHANAVENYPLFVAATLFGTIAGVENVVVNRVCAVYTAARVVYAALYLGIERGNGSYARSLAWWVGNGSCLYLLWVAGTALKQGIVVPHFG